MKLLLAVFAGGGLGSLLRYLISMIFLQQKNAFPSATLIVNFAGSFLLGLFMHFFLKKIPENETLRLFVTVGFCGGFTTMSTFSLESLKLLQNGQNSLFLLYLIFTIALCIIGTWAGWSIVRG